MAKKPTIKGLFVNSHINEVRRQKGREGLKILEKHYGKPLRFKNSENVPIREEVKIIEFALDCLSERPVPRSKRAFEAGRLHFRNFRRTPLAKIIFSLFRKKFKLMMLQAHNIAGHVFQGVKFSSIDLGPEAVRVVMQNNDYPLDHFRGLFQEWLEFAGHQGNVAAKETLSNQYEYTITWS